MTIATEPRVGAQFLPKDLEQIFREHYGFVYRTAYRMTGNLADAEDVLQTLFLRLFRREFPLERESNPKAYLYRATLNIGIDVIRARNRHSSHSSDDEAVLLDIPDSAPSSRGKEELHDRLRAALAELKPKAAHIFVLRHVHGYTDVEIAKLLGTSRGTIAVSLFRSRRHLRRSIRATQ